MRNPWNEFAGLLPAPPRYVAKVINVDIADAASTVELPSGDRIRVRGIAVQAGQYAFVQGGEIRGPAPAVVPTTLEV